LPAGRKAPAGKNEQACAERKAPASWTSTEHPPPEPSSLGEGGGRLPAGRKAPAGKNEQARAERMAPACRNITERTLHPRRGRREGGGAPAARGG